DRNVTGVQTCALPIYPLATTALLAQVLVAAWSGRRAMDAWAQGAPPVGRDRWDLPRVGRVPADGMLWAVAGLSAIVAALILTGRSEERRGGEGIGGRA